MITIFSTTKPFKGRIGRIQKRAIKSWVDIKPLFAGHKHQIILLGNEVGTAEICKKHDLLHIPNINTNKYGTPYIDDLFRKAQNAAKYDVVAYVNADIILKDNFIYGALKSTKFENFLTIGQRHDWDGKELKLHSPVGMDYFIFRRGAWVDFPPMLIGRVMWDNYFVYLALKKGHYVIDATDFIHVTHQQHAHKKIDGVSVKFGPEQLINKKIGGKNKRFITHATWKIYENGDVQLVSSN